MRAHRWVFSILCLSLAACDMLMARTGARDRMISQIDRNRQQWQSLAIQDYDFTFLLLCDCTFATLGYVRVEVRGGDVARVTDGGTTDLTSQPGMKWPTVDSLFARARAMMTDEDNIVQLNFDTAYFFPSYVEGRMGRTGEIVRFTAEEFARLTTGARHQ
jgi:hypothetical protein